MKVSEENSDDFMAMKDKRCLFGLCTDENQAEALSAAEVFQPET